ncbi:MAG: hypothetical protein ACREVK_11250 [Gammaproteobacteria bacterium]
MTLQTADPTTQQVFDSLVALLREFFVSRKIPPCEGALLLTTICRDLVVKPETDPIQREITWETLALTMRTEAPLIPQPCPECALAILRRGQTERSTVNLQKHCPERGIDMSVTFVNGRAITWTFAPLERQHAAIH